MVSVAHTEPLAARRGEGMAGQVGRPLEAELVHQLLAAVLGGQAQRPTGGQGVLGVEEVRQEMGVDSTRGDVLG